LTSAACAELTTPSSEVTSSLAAAFTAVPVGFENLTSTFAASSDGGPTMWLPGPRGIGLGGGVLMGGGLGEAFVGSMGFGGRGHGGHRGPFGGLSCNGTFSAAAGRVVCDSVVRNGITTKVSIRYTTTSGAVQQAFDTLTTNTVNVQTTVTGTATFERDTTRGRDGRGGRGHGPGFHQGRIAGDTTTILTAATTVNHASDRTVSGLAQGSTQRTVNGASSGNENTTGTSSRGNFTAGRTTADTTRGLVIPVSDTGKTFPTAGTVIRVMQATITFAGSAAATSSRREVITYDGTATAKVVITKDGVTQNCTLPLPHGRLTCSQ
ncbi:MAG: hypothetical protein ACRENH_10555, partial [Gemmatimonadaceae bacterium]